MQRAEQVFNAPASGSNDTDGLRELIVVRISTRADTAYSLAPVAVMYFASIVGKGGENAYILCVCAAFIWDDSAQGKLRLQQTGTAQGFLLSDYADVDVNTSDPYIGVLFLLSASFQRESA